MRRDLFGGVLFRVGLALSIVGVVSVLSAFVLLAQGRSYETYLLPVLVLAASGTVFVLTGALAIGIAALQAARRARVGRTAAPPNARSAPPT